MFESDLEKEAQKSREERARRENEDENYRLEQVGRRMMYMTEVKRFVAEMEEELSTYDRDQDEDYCEMWNVRKSIGRVLDHEVSELDSMLSSGKYFKTVAALNPETKAQLEKVLQLLLMERSINVAMSDEHDYQKYKKIFAKKNKEEEK